VRNAWFQQDGATTHAARQSKTFLSRMFPGRLISQFGGIAWPAHSPAFSCGGISSPKYMLLYPHSTQELKDRIKEGTGTINGALLQSDMQKLRQ
jgi:hypothetical protein